MCVCVAAIKEKGQEFEKEKGIQYMGRVGEKKGKGENDVIVQ